MKQRPDAKTRGVTYKKTTGYRSDPPGGDGTKLIVRPTLPIDGYFAGDKYNAKQTRTRRGPPRKRRRLNSGLKTLPVPIHARESQELANIYWGTPAVALAAQHTQDKLLGIPFEVTVGQAEGANSVKLEDGTNMSSNDVFRLLPEVRDEIIGRYWMPTLRDVDRRRIMHGYAPYYFEPVPDPTSDELWQLVPRVPPLDSGHTHIFARNAVPELIWKWNPAVVKIQSWRIDAEGFDRTVRFVVEHMPTLKGRHTNRLLSVVGDLRYANDLRAARREQERSLATPLHIFEFSPDVAQVTAAWKAGEGAGESTMFPNQAEIPETNIEALDNYLAAQGRSSTDTRPHAMADWGRETLLPEDLINRSGGGLSSHVWRDSGAGVESALEGLFRHNQEQYQRMEVDCMNNSGSTNVFKPSNGILPPNTYKAKPYERYVAGATAARGGSDVDAALARAAKAASVVVGFPLEAIQDHTGRNNASDSDSAATRFLRDTLRSLSRFYAEVVETMFYEAYEAHFSAGQRGLEQRFRRLYNHKPDPEEAAALRGMLSVEVTFPRSPDVDFERVAVLYTHRMIDKPTFWRYAADVFGLAVSASGVPDPLPEGFEDALDRLYPLPLTPEEELAKEEQSAAIQHRYTQTPAGNTTNGGNKDAKTDDKGRAKSDREDTKKTSKKKKAEKEKRKASTSGPD